MAISVPRLQRIQPSESLPANDRIQMQAPDVSSTITSRTNAVASLAAEGVDLYYDIEDSKITQLSQEAEQEYTVWNNDQLQKLKSYEGDPTDAYAAYEESAAQKQNEILTKRPDLNERVKSHLTTNLNKTVEGHRVQAMKQRGAQQETYANNLYESSVKLKKDNLGVSAGFIKKDDPGSFLPFDENIADIKTTIAKRGMEKGIAKRLPDDAKSWNHIYKDEEGKMVKVELSDIAKQRAAKELSEGVGASINSMIASGYTEEAQAAYDRYKSYLDPKTTATLNNKFETSTVKTSAFNEIGRIESLPPSQQMQAIESIQDPKLKSEVLKIKDTNDARREHMRDRREKANFEVLGNRVLNKMKSDTPFFGMADLESDPVFKATYDRLDVKGKKAILAMVDAPKDSDPKAKVRLQNLMFGLEGKNIEDLTPLEFADYKKGLSKADQAKADTKYEKLKNPSSGEKNSIYKVAGLELQESLIMSGDIEENKYGKIAGDDKITLLKAQDRLEQEIETGGLRTRKEIKEFINAQRANLIKENYTSAVTKKSVNAPPPKDPASTAPAKTNEIVLSPTEIISLKKKFRDANGYIPVKNDPKFQTFIQNNK